MSDRYYTDDGEPICWDGDTTFEQPGQLLVDGQPVSRGLVQRPEGIVYSKGVAAPPSFPVLDASEIARLAAELASTRSRISDIRMKGDGGQMIVNLDQGQQGYCVTADTEVLTEKGWTPFPEWNGTDLIGTMNQTTGNLEFQASSIKHVYQYDGDMVYSTNRRLDFGVTPDHRMLLRKWDERQRTLSSQYAFQRAADIGWYAGVPHATRGYVGIDLKHVSVPGDREYSGDDFVSMLSMIVSDGYAGGTDKTRNWVSFCCFREDRYYEAAAIAARIGFSENPSKRGVWTRYDAGALAEWVRTHCYTSLDLKAPSKKIPDIIKNLSMRQIRMFLSRFGDQNHGENSDAVFYSSSNRVVDDLQELHLRIGKRSTISEREPRTARMDNGKEIHGGKSFVLFVSDTDRLCIERKKHIETDRYKGLVYCATVLNGTMVTRRNGSVLISGNCWAHSSAHAVMLSRAVQNMPYVPLSAYAVACIIKQYRDEGGWAALSMDFIVNRGIPSQAKWPQLNKSRSNDNPDTWADAAKYKVTEGFWDSAAAPYDRQFTFQQRNTLLVCRQPCASDYMHMSHSVCDVDVVDGASLYRQCRSDRSGKLLDLATHDLIWGTANEVTTGLAVRYFNSWKDWGVNGMGILTGNKAIPDGSVCPLVSNAA